MDIQAYAILVNCCHGAKVGPTGPTDLAAVERWRSSRAPPEPTHERATQAPQDCPGTFLFVFDQHRWLAPFLSLVVPTSDSHGSATFSFATRMQSLPGHSSSPHASKMMHLRAFASPCMYPGDQLGALWQSQGRAGACRHLRMLGRERRCRQGNAAPTRQIEHVKK
jgi:hypothetical protein